MAVMPAPQDVWQTILRILDWAWRIPIAMLVIFAACCGLFLGAMTIWRTTVWVYSNWLNKPF
jgi:hypothetical protein